jgi:6-phosphogluconolactonase (cycloisomerase 2 family)
MIGTRTGMEGHADFDPATGDLTKPKLAAEYRNPGFLAQHPTKPVLLAVGSGAPMSDSRFVYASNRGHDSIAVFAHDEKTGALAFIQHAPCGGKTPRHFKIAPGGKWLLCAHQDSDSISVLPRDPLTGRLGAASDTVTSPSPICLLFAR